MTALLLGAGCCSWCEHHCPCTNAYPPPQRCCPQGGYVAGEPAQGPIQAYVPPQRNCSCTCTCTPN
jgi:hypothetical protein